MFPDTAVSLTGRRKRFALLSASVVRDGILSLQRRNSEDIKRRTIRRLIRSLSDRFDITALDFPLLPQDIADSYRLNLETPPRRENVVTALNVAWLCTPPGPGSGGHTTLFRMVQGMEERGHRCTLLLYNRHGSDMSRAESTIRRHWPWLQSRVVTVPDVIKGYDACVASSWETAHVLAQRSAMTAVHRFYFIQDFEPFFYPRGSLYSLAEDSYRFGFTSIALGNMVAGALREHVGISVAKVPFGCDASIYSLENAGSRKGIVFYARETCDRRGTLLGKLALTEFHARHPEQPIHVYGDPLPSWSVPHHHHGKLSPEHLHHLYNQGLAGLALSFTNISLVAEEMLACGMVPVVNDHPYAREDLPSAGVLWAPATPAGIADALCRAVEEPLPPHCRHSIASEVHKNWAAAQAGVAAIIEKEA